MSLIIVRSKIFSKYPTIISGISTRAGGVSPSPLGLNLSFKVGDAEENVNNNRALFFGGLGIDSARVVYPGQVHGSNVVDPPGAGRVESCDALVTNKTDLFLAVSIADCLPILLFDPVARCVAAVHSGWRGSVAQILHKAVTQLSEWFASRPADLVAFLGPSAGVCCYQVGEEVVHQFPHQFVARNYPGNPHLDLRGFNREILLEAGVPSLAIEVSSHCTICDTQFHSYRRDGAASGRMLAVIGMKSGEV